MVPESLTVWVEGGRLSPPDAGTMGRHDAPTHAIELTRAPGDAVEIRDRAGCR